MIIVNGGHDVSSEAGENVYQKSIDSPKQSKHEIRE